MDKSGLNKKISETMGTRTLLGDPKKAIIKLSIPMIIAMSVQTIYQLADAIWVSGKGPEALAAVGFFFPFYMLVNAFAVGLGIGGGAAISRRIGAKNAESANSVAVHTIVLMFILSILFTIPLLTLTKPIFRLMGAVNAFDLTVSYARIMFGGTLLIFFSNVANTILRSEGDAKRAMMALVIGALLNIILDPIFIYQYELSLLGIKFSLGFGLGVSGAAVATVISIGISCVFLFYWLFVQKNIYITFRFKGFRFKKEILKDISKVGLPSILSMMSISIMMLILTKVIVIIGGDDGVAIFTTGWRVIMFAILPILGIATAVTSVSGAVYGAKDYDKLGTAHLFAVKMAIIIEICFAVITFFLAPYITKIFTWSPNTMRIADDITHMFRVMCIFYPAVAGGMLSSSLFQGTGKGFYSLTVSATRTLLLGVPFPILFAIVFKMGMTGIYLGIITATWISSIIAFTWGRLYIRKLKTG
ncbi:MATE family efflux transporter [Spirochaetota bacterium]